jgi:integral membrane protein
VLLLLYALFTLSAGARALVQLGTHASRAPVAYTLSLVAAVTYALGWVAIRRAAVGRTGFASRMLWIELTGVLTVGTLSLVQRGWFPDASVWSDYGIGYAFVPTALPVLALLWLRTQGAGAAWDARIVTAFRVVAFVEALTWLGLLTGMFFRYVVDAGDGGVRFFGPVHGTVFLVYAALALVTARLQRWSVGVALLALAASVPPFCTALFEVWAQRTGRLDVVRPEPAREPVGSAGG